MDYTLIIQVITSVGFPIVACIGCAWYVKYTTDNYRQEVKEMRQEHTEEVGKMTDALSNNTLAIQRLTDKLENKEV